MDYGSVEEIKVKVREAKPGIVEGTPAWEAAVFLLSAVAVGPRISKIAKFMGVPKLKVQPLFDRAIVNGVFTASRIHIVWSNENADGFWGDVGVLLGYTDKCKKYVR